MNNARNQSEIGFDQALLEQVNPVFQTAKMTLFQLTLCGDQDAAVLAKRMGLTQEQTQNSATTIASPEQILGSAIMLEARYRTMASLAESSGYVPVDLPCGYTPRAISFAKKGISYYGLDLPAVIREIPGHINALIPEEKRGLVHYREVDATNYASLEKALEDIDGKVCITTEGLLMYFTDSEAGVLCDNIRRILEKKGGCWYTTDPECSLQYVITMRAVAGDRFKEIMQNAIGQTRDKSDVEIGKNPLITQPADMQGSIRNAMAFLAKHGLKAERVIVADHLPELNSFSRISPAQVAAIREGCKLCAYWKITPKGSGAETHRSEAKDFDFSASIQSGTLTLALSGRLDTITAPRLLAFYQDLKDEHTIDAVSVDCKDLDYISSAGLRVLLIMHKNCENGVSVTNANEVVMDIMRQTGFDTIFN